MSIFRIEAKKITIVALSVVVSFAFVAVAVNGATTISTNIVTGGTLSVTGASTLTGLATFSGGATTTTITLLNGEIISNATDGTIQLGGIASTTSIVLLNGETITNATDGTIALTGAMTVSGASTLTGLATLLGGATTTTLTLLNGETITNATDGTVSISGSTSLSTTTVEALTVGGENCTLTDADGGTLTLTQEQMARCSLFEFAASGAGQEVIALTFPATSTMTTLIPNSGDCREWLYDASALAAATTTTMTAGTGHNIIAYTTADDVIDGNEFAQIQMCRRSDTDVNTIVTELLHAD